MTGTPTELIDDVQKVLPWRSVKRMNGASLGLVGERIEIWTNGSSHWLLAYLDWPYPQGAIAWAPVGSYSGAKHREVGAPPSTGDAAFDQAYVVGGGDSLRLIADCLTSRNRALMLEYEHLRPSIQPVVLRHVEGKGLEVLDRPHIRAEPHPPYERCSDGCYRLLESSSGIVTTLIDAAVRLIELRDGLEVSFKMIF